MSHTFRHHHTRARRSPRIVLGIIACIVIAVLWFIVRQFVALADVRHTIVLVGEPMYVVSWDASRSHVVMLNLPSDLVIEGAHGYGKYPVLSLYRLDQIDQRGGQLFLDSVSDALGLPVSGFVRLTSTDETRGTVEYLRSVFSWKSVISPYERQGIPWGEWIRLVVATQWVKIDKFSAESITGALVSRASPDGSKTLELDPARFDFLYAAKFIDAGLRAEQVSVGVYNTTGTPTIGVRTARMLTTIGIPVLTVGNDSEVMLTRCSVTGTKAALNTKTARFISSYFHCDMRQVSLDEGPNAELTLRLGREYASVYAPVQ